MDQRKGDPRIYIITILFLSCIISGGVFLGLYLLLPDPNPLFLQAGMIFVGVPWFFWFLAYLYSCILKPCTVSVTNSFDLEKADKNIPETTPDDDESATATAVAKNSPKEGEKHVQFGNVVVFGNENEDENHQNEGSSNNLIQNRVEEDEDDEEHKEGKGRLISQIDNDTNVDQDCDKTPLRSSSTKK